MRRLTTWLRRLALFALLGMASCWAAAQPAPTAAAETYSQEELDQILAPVALYPDTLLMQVLAAATYPLEIVEAERFIRANPKLKGEAMTRAAANKAWDLSVISLLQFPSVLTMMNDKLDWTQQLGDVFLAQQPEVMDTVQALRARAQQAGNLKSTAQQSVVVQEKIIVIEPAQPQVVYCPTTTRRWSTGPGGHPPVRPGTGSRRRSTGRPASVTWWQQASSGALRSASATTSGTTTGQAGETAASPSSTTSTSST